MKPSFELVKRPFSKKSVEDEEKNEVVEETSLVDSDYNRKKLFRKGVNFMADEKLEDAIIAFEQALRVDPDNVETLLKLGYAKFHTDDHGGALNVYDRILEYPYLVYSELFSYKINRVQSFINKDAKNDFIVNIRKDLFQLKRLDVDIKKIYFKLKDEVKYKKLNFLTY